MKIRGFQKRGLAVAAAIAVALSTSTFAQDAATPTPAATTPVLSPAAAQVLQLSEAKISDGTIITFVQNSGSTYGLSASQIVYLKQQGVSESVLNAMLIQHPAPTAVAQPAPMDNASSSVAATTTADVAQPSSPAPSSSSVYVVPDTQTYYYNNWAYPYYYPYYGYGYYGGWPVGVSFYWGHGGYYRGGGWGGGWHGGGGGSWHGGGGGGGGWHH